MSLCDCYNDHIKRELRKAESKSPEIQVFYRMYKNKNQDPKVLISCHALVTVLPSSNAMMSGSASMRSSA